MTSSNLNLFSKAPTPHTIMLGVSPLQKVCDWVSGSGLGVKVCSWVCSRIGWEGRLEGAGSLWALGQRPELPKWQEGWRGWGWGWRGEGVSLAGQTKLFFVQALERQGSGAAEHEGCLSWGDGAELSHRKWGVR